MKSWRGLLYPENILTLLRIPLAIVFLLFLDNIPALLIILIIAGITDILDGWIARKYKRAGKLGAILDPICDKFFYVIVAISVFSVTQTSWKYLFLFLFREGVTILNVCVNYVKGWKKMNFDAVLWGKITTVLQFLTLMIMLIFPKYALVGIYSVFVSGAIAGSIYVGRYKT